MTAAELECPWKVCPISDIVTGEKHIGILLDDDPSHHDK